MNPRRKTACLSLLLVLCLFAVSCHKSNISQDKALLKGKYSHEFLAALQDSSYRVRTGTVTHFTENYVQETSLNPDGTFEMEIPVVCPTLCHIELLGYYIHVSLLPGKETRFEIDLDKKSNQRRLKMGKGKGFSEQEWLHFRELFDNMTTTLSNSWGISKDMDSNEYREHINQNRKEFIDRAAAIPNTSREQKQLLKRNLEIYYLANNIFRFEEIQFERPVKTPADFTFLKYFNLNDPGLWGEINYRQVFRKMLSDNILNIPPIGNHPLNDWIKTVKSILTPVIGFDKGWFYDLLVANAYMNHLHVYGGSFSDGQIADIKSYFTNQTCIDLLLAESEKKLPPTYFDKKETPKVPKEKLLDAIVSQYKGKVLVIDFWATWCLPCLRAIETAKPLKEIFQNQNVAFVYISDATSDYTLWETKAPEIGGSHYWISKEEGIYIRQQLNITGIPAYAIYDATGQLYITFIAYPGNAAMQQTIEKLLKTG